MDPHTILLLRSIFLAIGIDCKTVAEIMGAAAAMADCLDAAALTNHKEAERAAVPPYGPRL